MVKCYWQVNSAIVHWSSLRNCYTTGAWCCYGYFQCEDLQILLQERQEFSSLIFVSIVNWITSFQLSVVLHHVHCSIDTGMWFLEPSWGWTAVVVAVNCVFVHWFCCICQNSNTETKMCYCSIGIRWCNLSYFTHPPLTPVFKDIFTFIPSV